MSRLSGVLAAALIAGASFVAAAPASAAVLYEFKVTPDDFFGDFNFDATWSSPDFIAGDADIPLAASDLLSCSVSLSGQAGGCKSLEIVGANQTSLSFNAAFLPGFPYLAISTGFVGADFAHDGVWTNNNGASLTISGSPSGAPEPASWALAIVGLGLSGAALRARRRLSLPAT